MSASEGEKSAFHNNNLRNVGWATDNRLGAALHRFAEFRQSLRTTRLFALVGQSGRFAILKTAMGVPLRDGFAVATKCCDRLQGDIIT
jgi:hypothetical protein